MIAWTKLYSCHFIWFPGRDISCSHSSLISRSGKRGILKWCMSSLQLLRCLELPWCSISKEQIKFLLTNFFFIQIFPQVQAKDLFTICLSESRLLSECGMWSSRHRLQCVTESTLSLEMGINFTHGPWYRPWHGLWASAGVFLTERITSKQLASDEVELSAKREKTADLYWWGIKTVYSK